MNPISSALPSLALAQLAEVSLVLQPWVVNPMPAKTPRI